MLILNQTERLVRRIGELLGQPALEAQAAKLAQDYCELGRAAIRRLEQCSVMIDAGEELQALQLAETPPPLLDLITILSFRQAGEWREYCQKRGLPFVEPFYDKFVRQLNAAYGKGLANDHPYYRDYRRAVLQNDDERALSILRVIAKLNPSDHNVAQELQRLEDKLLRARLEQLRQTTEAGNAAAVLNQLAELERSALPIPPSNPIWLKAQLLRCRQLLDHAQATRQDEAWMEVESTVEEIRALANQNGVPLTPEDTARWNALEAWTNAQRASLAREQDSRRAFESLDYSLQTSEQQRDNLSRQKAPQIQAELNSLNAKWQEAAGFGDLDAALANRCQAQCDWLGDRIQRARQRQRMVRLLWTGLVVAALAVAAFFFWDYSRQRELTEQLGRFERQRRVGETQKLLAGLSPRLKARLAPSVSQGEQFVAAELASKQAYEQKLADFQRALNGDAGVGGPDSGLTPATAAEVERRRSDCLDSLGRLAPEFQTAAKNSFETMDQKWQNRLGTLQPEHNAQFSVRLSQAEQAVATQLNPTNRPEAVREALPGIQLLVTDLDRLHRLPVPISEDLSRRFIQLTNQVGVWDQALAEWNVLLAAHPHSLEEHLDRLKKLARSPLASPLQKTCIDEIDRLSLNPCTLLGQLLLPSQPEFWDSLTNLSATPPVFRPETPSDTEQEAFLRLRDDPNMHDIYAYWIGVNTNRRDNPFESHAIFTRGLITTNRSFQPTGLIYDFKKYPGELRFEQQTINTYDYAVLDKKGLTQESDAFTRLGLRDLIDPNSGKYQKSMLELLDRLNQETECSTLFRAYVVLRLIEIAQARPPDWGLQWAPSVRKERQGLEDLKAQNLQSGDWMVLNQTLTYKDGLQQFFNTMAEISFEKQARFFYRLTQQAVEKGFEFAGYVDEQGVLVLSQTNLASGELWGWSSRSRSAALLLKRAGDGTAWQPLEEPLRFTPLFEFLGDRRLLLDQSSKLNDYKPSAAPGLLPPLFSSGM